MNAETYQSPQHGWTCFHCGETFHGHQAARLHFGASIYDEPKCQISAHKVRAMEEQLRRYRGEDTDLHRQIMSMQADHATALRRTEEQGYARGIKDYGVLADLSRRLWSTHPQAKCDDEMDVMLRGYEGSHLMPG